jgi:iron complex outermembrane receptor protein
MFQRTKICSGLLMAFGSLMAQQGHAQDAAANDAGVQRVEVTGSAIRRIDAEGALPVLVLKKEDIQKTGATSTVDLLQRLSTVQGGTPEAGSVGGSTYGFSGVSIHDVGETRTLVLLNGHRLTQFGGQTLTGFAAGFDLNAIPVSAIERVEVLTDGASALYGADAIAGVVNFITKRDFTGVSISGGFSAPKGGAHENRLSISGGVGNLDTDGFNVEFTYGHDKRTPLKASSRSFASTGNLVFQQGGKTYRSQNYSASSVPANVLDDNGNLISPYLIANGKCPTNTFRVTDGGDDFCGFDYVSTLEIYPERSRDSLMVSGTARVGTQELFADVLLSSTKQTSRIAAVPGSISISADSALFQQYLAPLGITEDTLAYYRVNDLGARTDADKADFLDFAVGSRGSLGSVDYTATYTHSQSTAKANISGYPGALALSALRASGLLNPFVLTGEQTAAGQAALNGANYKGYWDGGTASLDTVQVQGSSALATLPAGDLSLALGANINKEKFQSKPSLFAQGKLSDPVAGTLCDPDAGLACDQRFGDAAAEVPYSANRTSWGVFSEVNVPVVKGLDFTGDVRFDHFSDFGSATTGKVSFRYAPAKSFLLRGSVGTGFHAPSVPQVKAAPQSYGVTSDPYECTTELQEVATSLGAQCQPGKRQYDVVAGGNAALKPERSKQATIGMLLEPTSYFSASIDYWWVNIRDSFGTLSENTVFANPLKYAPGAWTTQTDIATGVKYLAWNAGNANLGKLYKSGIDFNGTLRGSLGAVGSLVSNVTATHMIRSRFQQEQGGEYFNDLGDNSQGSMAFRWKGAWRNTVTTGAWSNTLSINFQSGYWDAETDVEEVDASGTVLDANAKVRIHVKPYYTADWQTAWVATKNLSLSVGLLNLTNKKPPFVLNTTGGQQVGYDANLYDPRGRTVYVNGTLKF